MTLSGKWGAADFLTLLTVADLARRPRRLERQDVAFIRNILPDKLDAFPKVSIPAKIRHPAGFPIAGAPVKTFLRSALLVAGRSALGYRFGGSEFYHRVERDLAFSIMRSHFHLRHPKGAYCCVQCTLAVLPVLEVGAIRYFDCGKLADDVSRLVRRRRWRFAGPVDPRMVGWSIGSRAIEP